MEWIIQKNNLVKSCFHQFMSQQNNNANKVIIEIMKHVGHPR
jgi:hypothetical protein